VKKGKRERESERERVREEIVRALRAEMFA